MTEKRFNIRVYGILVNNHGEVLVSDELIRGLPVTKFPGGGLEYGEGTIECLHREFDEELGIQIEVLDHLYTTDFFQPSAFSEHDQIMSIYYRVSTPSVQTIKTQSDRFDFKSEEGMDQAFRWLPLETLSEEDFSLPIDKHVVKILPEM